MRPSGVRCYYWYHMKGLVPSYLVCPVCYSPIKQEGARLICVNRRCGSAYSVVNGIVQMLPPNLAVDLRLTRDKWDCFYRDQQTEQDYEGLYREYQDRFYPHVHRQLKESLPLKDKVFLELGCGPFLLGQALSSECRLVIGVEISLSALRIAKEMLDQKGITNYLLVLGDINRLPLRSGSVDLAYGGGVIEHFKNTPRVIEEIYRVLAPGGVSFNTVPYLNLATLTYSQRWGNIPNFPVLKQLAELVHIKLLKSKHMRFGYELSFTGSYLDKIHRRAGFSQVEVGRFETTLLFEYFPFEFLRKMCSYLATNSRLFWPMVKVVGRK